MKKREYILGVIDKQMLDSSERLAAHDLYDCIQVLGNKFMWVLTLELALSRSFYEKEIKVADDNLRELTIIELRRDDDKPITPDAG